ncbi:MAG: hypothetical protein ACE5HT_02740 [Gemmatimonadales bacterium]
MRRNYHTALQCFLSIMALSATTSRAGAQAVAITTDLLDGLRFRSIGPAVMGGRIHDVEALPDDPSTIYVASASGGIWKSTNKGTTWTPIFDHQAVSTFGDVAIAPSDHSIIWAGTGGQNNRQSTSWGNGVYRSADGGESWKHMGLDETRHIGRVVVDPNDADVAYVAALGSLWAPSEERGVYKTTNGGKKWKRVLFVDTLTGVVDLVMDPTDPSTLYAATYQRQRRTWGFNGGGAGSGIYKTTDGGRHWRELTDGLPHGDKGRIGLAIARTAPNVLNATIEHASESGTYRTTDGGETWQKVSSTNPRPMYYSHIFIDPTDENRVYLLATNFYKSEDGGHTFKTLPTRPTYDVGVHSDYHTLWIDPNNPEHFYLAGDGGLHESWDMGQTYVRINNIPIGQFYAIDVDMRTPYHIYGGMQDNHSWMGPSATRRWAGIINDDWQQIGFGDGMYQQADPTSHRYVYVLAQNGNLSRFDAVTGDALGIRPAPPTGEAPYRFDWTTPSLVSQHDPRTIYLGGNRLFISHDRGETWERTPDLSREMSRDTLRLMGVLGSDLRISKNDGTSSFGEITTISESPLTPDILWVGTDDGNLQLSRDGGATWTELSGNVPDVPTGTYVSRVAASVTDQGTVYVTFDAHRDGDFQPYVFRSVDFGQSWSNLGKDLPTGSANVIVEYAGSPNLLFLGTEHALFVSTDAGTHWAKFRANLPTTLYDDVVIQPREKDLVVATHGRSLWILDDLTPLAEWVGVSRSKPVHLFSIRRTTIFQYWKDTSYRGQAAYAGENPPFGAIVSYYLANQVASASIEVTNRAGELIRTIQVPRERGIHRVTWDLRHEPPPPSPTNQSQPAIQLAQPVLARGPFVSPGTYTVTLDADGVRATQRVSVVGDPLMAISDDQWNEREEFLMDLQQTQQQVQETTEAVATLVRELSQSTDSSSATLDSARALQRTLRQLRRRAGGLASEFNGQGVRQGSLYPPTATHRQRKSQLEESLHKAMASLEELERKTG